MMKEIVYDLAYNGSKENFHMSWQETLSGEVSFWIGGKKFVMDKEDFFAFISKCDEIIEELENFYETS